MEDRSNCNNLKQNFEFCMEQSKVNAEIGLEERNTILQAWADFKDSIFNVLFVILDKKSEDEDEESLVRLALESGLDYLQILAFPFNAMVVDAWNGGESLQGLSKFFKQFSIGSYLPGAPFSAFLVVLYGLIFIILLIILDIIYVSYSFSKKKFRFTFPLVVLAQVVPLFVTVLFLPITEILLNVVECEHGSGGWFMTSFPEVECWTGWHLFHSSITLLFVAAFVVISSVVALALFQSRMTTKRLTARQNSNGEVVFILNKIILLFIFIFNPIDGSFFYVTMLFLLSFWQFWCYSVKQPYYSKAAGKFFKICSTYYFWTATMLFVGQVAGSYGFDGALVIWMSGLPFFAVIIYFESPSDSTLFASNLKFKSGEQLEAHLTAVLQLVGSQGSDKNSYMLLIGYIEKHKEVCNELDCPLKAERRKRKGEESMDYSCQQVLKQVERMFKSGIKKFPDCTKLRMSYGFFQLEHMRSKEKAYEEFANSAKLDPSFQQQFNIYRFKKIIRENLESREGSDADLIETIRFENYVSLLEEAMLLSAKLHKEFWTELKEEIPDLKKLNLVGAQITEAGNSIAQNYNELSKINASACEVLYSYGHYLILVSEDYTQGREMLQNARKMYQDRQSGHKNLEELHFEEHSLNKMTSPVLILTVASPGTLPRIANINLMFTEVTGYQREELIDREVTKVAPRLFAKEGVSCFELIMGEDQRQREGFLNHKFNHLITVQYSVAHRVEEGEWHVVFKLASSSSMKLVLLSNQQGEITDTNLLAQTAFKEIQNADEGQVLTLKQIGLDSFASQLFRRQNGSIAQVKLGSKTGECMVQVQPIAVHIYGENGQADDEEERMVILREKNIGYKVSLSKSERVHIEEEDSISEGSARKESQLDGGVLELYDNPNVIDIFLSNLAETKQLDEQSERFQLKDKIKTMRLLNNQIKMVYAEGAESDYADAAGSGQGDDQRELFKFDDEGYQAKLRSAINTNLNHVEVINLRRASYLFLSLLFLLNILELYFQTSQVLSVKGFLKQISNRAEEYSLLTSNIMAVIDSSTNYSALFDYNSAHVVHIDSDVSVQLQLENNFTVERNLKDAVILLNSRLLSYFQERGTPAEIASIFKNYVSAMYPAFLNYPGQASVSLAIPLIVTGCIALLAIVMMGYWIYIGVLIDKKRYDIMIWFLDIPVPYVTHLGKHCDKYLKEFATIKELTQRGISLEEEEDSYEEYSNKKNANDDEEIEEQIKARKSLISKNKKETLLSKVNLSSLKVVWLLIYAGCFSILLLVLAGGFNTDYAFLLPQWSQTSQAIIVDNTLYLALQMQDHNISAGNANLTALASTLQLAHKGVITDNNLESFNYNILNFHLPDVASIYNTVYFSNLCTVLNLPSSNLTQCQSLVGSKLKSGYEVYSKYLITPQKAMNGQIWLANQLYVIPALISMLQVWQQKIASQGSSLINLCTILLYVFVIFSVICFLLFWLYYLRKLNVQLNQTIQMLNMIPFKLLPKSRKETKLFIAWIIRQANKTKHQNQ